MSTYQEELERAYRQARGGGFRPVVCVGRDTCKLCGLIRPILNFKDKHEPSVVTKANDMRAKFQHFSNVCFEPDYSKVVLFAFSKQIMDGLSILQLDPLTSQDYGDFAHPQRGRIILVTKSIGENGRPRYTVAPRAHVHKLPALGMGVHNLTLIKELLKQGTEYFPQSKLDVKTTPIRFIGFGPDQTRFFRTVELHWGLSQENYESIQRGGYNPFSLADADVFNEDENGGNSADKEVEAYEEKLEQEKIHELDRDVPDFSTVPDVEIVQLPGKVSVEPAQEQKTKPHCYGIEFDIEDPECQVKCKEWNESCKAEFLKKYGVE